MARVTVEDSLKKEPNRFALVILAAKRAKQILTGSDPLIKNEKNKSIVTALREIASGDVRFLSKEDIEKREQLRAIEQESKFAEVDKAFEAGLQDSNSSDSSDSESDSSSDNNSNSDEDSSSSEETSSSEASPSEEAAKSIEDLSSNEITELLS